LAHNGKRRSKIGRSKTKCEFYRKFHKHEKAHIRRIERHISKYRDTSEMVQCALAKYYALIRS